jgi:hypothetical protein
MNSTHSAIIMLLTVVVVLATSAQDFSLEPSAIVGGGGTATAGVYTLTGTIGQSGAGRIHSKDFTIDGGSWGVVAAIQEPGGAAVVRSFHANEHRGHFVAGRKWASSVEARLRGMGLPAP